MENLSSYWQSAAAAAIAKLRSSSVGIVIAASAIAGPRVVPGLASSNAAPPTPVTSGPKPDAWITMTGKTSTAIGSARAA